MTTEEVKNELNGMWWEFHGLYIDDNLPDTFANKVVYGFDMGSGFESIYSGRPEKRSLHPLIHGDHGIEGERPFRDLTPDHIIFIFHAKEMFHKELKSKDLWNEDDHNLLKERYLESVQTIKRKRIKESLRESLTL